MVKNNKGFTLIELIIVIALLAITFTTFGGNISQIMNARVDKCASDFTSTISNIRINSMTKENMTYMLIHKVADKYKFTTYVDGVVYKEELYDNSFIISFDNKVIGTDVASVKIEFDKSKGSAVQGFGEYKIQKKGSHKETIIVLHELTGKYSVTKIN